MWRDESGCINDDSDEERKKRGTRRGREGRSYYRREGRAEVPEVLRPKQERAVLLPGWSPSMSPTVSSDRAG